MTACVAVWPTVGGGSCDQGYVSCDMLDVRTCSRPPLGGCECGCVQDKLLCPDVKCSSGLQPSNKSPYTHRAHACTCTCTHTQLTMTQLSLSISTNDLVIVGQLEPFFLLFFCRLSLNRHVDMSSMCVHACTCMFTTLPQWSGGTFPHGGQWETLHLYHY